ncbi:hypothetical protein ACFXEL_18720 [Streptomyces sp. NPDC059382]|uniref:hypothetical protein n=1 Tax=Streptomyces sp. NPDC059382 TaxID=3346816 RepID=UPI00368965DD
MSAARSIARRVVLAVAGGLLVTGGAAALAAEPAVAGRLPAGVPTFATGTTWVDPGALDAWRAATWWPAAALAALAVTALLSAVLLVRQARTGTLRRLPLRHTGADLAGRALRDAVGERLRIVPGVARARVRVTGRPDDPVLRIALTLEDTARPADVLGSHVAAVLDEARVFLAPRPLPAEVRCRVRRGTPPRAR